MIGTTLQQKINYQKKITCGQSKKTTDLISIKKIMVFLLLNHDLKLSFCFVAIHGKVDIYLRFCKKFEK